MTPSCPPRALVDECRPRCHSLPQIPITILPWGYFKKAPFQAVAVAGRHQIALAPPCRSSPRTEVADSSSSSACALAISANSPDSNP